MALTSQLFSNSTTDASSVVLECAGVSMSRRELQQAVASCAWRLASQHGIEKGHRIAGISLNSADALVLLLALAELRAIWVPLNWRLAEPELARILSDCEPVLLVADVAWFDLANALVAGTSRRLARMASLAAPPDASHAPLDSAAHSDDPVLLVYTSGTTGQPKGALHTQGNLVANMRAALDACEITPQDRVLTALPMFHVGGLCIHTLPALAVGACVVLHERFDASRVLASLSRDRISLALVVPATLQALIDHPDWASTDLGGLKAIWAGSSIVPRRLIEAVHARGVPVCNVYGSTETGPISLVLKRAQAMRHVGASGWPAAGVEIKLIDAKPDGDGQTGEIALRAPNIAQNYWPRIESVDSSGFFHTGDLAHMGANGCVTILGRCKELIISGGENIHPAEVEAVLCEHPWVAECAVFGVAHAQWGEVVEAAVVLLGPEQLENTGFSNDIGTWSPDSLSLLLSKTELSLLSFLQTKLAKFKCPKRIHVLAELPKTALGKVQKQRLAQQLSRIESA